MSTDLKITVLGDKAPVTFTKAVYMNDNSANTLDDVVRNLTNRNLSDDFTFYNMFSSGENLLDLNSLIDNYYIKDGVETSIAGDYCCTDFIEVKPGIKITMKNAPTFYGAFYDINKSFLRNITSEDYISTSPRILLIPNDVYFIRNNEQNLKSWHVNNGSMYLVNYDDTSLYIPYWKENKKIKESKLYGMRVNAIGDSIMALGDTWVKQMVKKRGIILNNYAVSGMTVAGNYGMYPKVELCDSDADIILFSGGINDANQSVPIGTIDDETVDTFYGALNKIFHDLIVKFPAKPIVVFSPPRGTNAKGVGTKLESGYLDAIQKCSAKWCLPFFDDYNRSGFNPISEISSEIISDDVHPNSIGHSILERVNGNFIESLIY